jgi:hypothetical protein
MKQKEEEQKHTDWPPFPLPDIYDNDDPHLIHAAGDAILIIHTHYEEIWATGQQYQDEISQQYQDAVSVAHDILGAWLSNDLVLPEIPRASKSDCPNKQDIFKLWQWFKNEK